MCEKSGCIFNNVDGSVDCVLWFSGLGAGADLCACCCLVYCDCYGRRSVGVKPMDFPSFAFLFYSFYLFFLMLFFLYLFSIQIKHQNFAGESAHYFAHTDCGFIKTEEGINNGNGECKWGIQCFDRPSVGVCVIYGIASEEEHQQFNSRPPSIIASYYAILWVVALLNLLGCHTNLFAGVKYPFAGMSFLCIKQKPNVMAAFSVY
jgi:hypothetical protein